MAEEKKSERTLVVVNLPTQEYNSMEADDGTPIKLLTVDQALTEILERVRNLDNRL